MFIYVFLAPVPLKTKSVRSAWCRHQAERTPLSCGPSLDRLVQVIAIDPL